MYYFGYGSNMLTARIQARVPEAKPLTPAVLNGARLRFHKRSRDGSGKCNIVSGSSNEHVYGVVFDVSSANLNALDNAENRGRGYERRSVSVRTLSDTLDAFAYVAQPRYVDDALHPYDWYHGLVLAGAQEHDLPSPYVAQLGTVLSYPDPNRRRRKKYASLLREAGFSSPYQ